MTLDRAATSTSPDAGFAGRLRSLRHSAGLSQEELAERARLSPDAVSSLERGTRTHPHPSTVRALADALGLSLEEKAAFVAAVPRRRRRSPASGVAPVPRLDHRPGALVIRPSALPRPPTVLLGRADDVAAVSALLADPHRPLITLTGLGGVGKTRLALAVAEQLGARWRDGVAFVPLAPVIDPDLVLPVIAETLGLSGDADVVEALASLELLLVIDNLEHLPGTSDVLASLIVDCPNVTVLATSRSSLRIRAETEYAVQPLRVPAQDVTDVDDVVGAPAAALLLERGRAIRPGLDIRPSDVPAVVQLCHQLAGLPLALELAAAGLRVLDPAALLDRLDEVLDAPGPVDLPARQHTMRATLDWSYGLLGERDRMVFRRATVFAGGFAIDAADSVLGEGVSVGALDRLVGQSLLVASRSPDGRARYEMLTPVTQYGRSLLGTAEAEAVARSHAEHFAALAEQAASNFHAERQAEWVAVLDVEIANLRSAIEWAIRGGHSVPAARLASSLWKYWWMRGPLPCARRLIDQILDLDLPDALRARTLVAAGALSEPGGGTGRAERAYTEALALAGAAGDLETEASALLALGTTALERGEFATAEKRLRRAARVAERAGERSSWYAGHAAVLSGAARRFQGDPAGAAALARAGLEPALRRGDRVATVTALYNLAQAENALGDHGAAREHLAQAAEACRDSRDAPSLSCVLDALASAEAPTAPPGRLATLLGAADGMRSAVGSEAYSFYGPDVASRERLTATIRHDLGDAAYWHAFETGRALGVDAAVELALGRPPVG